MRSKKTQAYSRYSAELEAGVAVKYPLKPEEAGQTLAEYGQHVREVMKSRLDGKVIYVSLIMFGKNVKAVKDRMQFQTIVDYLEAFFGVPEVVGPTQDMAEFEGGAEPWKDHYQYDSADLINHYLKGKAPKNALVHLGITNEDIMLNQRGWVHGVSGLADEELGCALFSTEGMDSGDLALYLNRALVIVTHEILHAFGFYHCEIFVCNMNPGSESIEGNDGTPLHLCPMCLEKLFLAFPQCDFGKRDGDLVKFYKKHKLDSGIEHMTARKEFQKTKGKKRSSDEVENGREDSISKKSRTK